MEENKSSSSLVSTLSISIYITVFSEHLLDWPGQEEASNGTKEKRLEGPAGSWRVCHLSPGVCTVPKAAFVGISIGCRLMHPLDREAVIKKQ